MCLEGTIKFQVFSSMSFIYLTNKIIILSNIYRILRIKRLPRGINNTQGEKWVEQQHGVFDMNLERKKERRKEGNYLYTVFGPSEHSLLTHSLE